MNFNKANMMKGKDRFTSAEIVKLRELITERQNAPRNSQKQLRNRMRKIGFFGRDDWGIIDCTLDDLDELIDTGKIKIIDKTTSTIITDKSKSKNAIINQGTNKNKDTSFETFYSQAKSVGLKVGAYWYSCADNSANGKSEAQYMINNCLAGKQFEFPIAMDVEDTHHQVPAGKSALTDAVVAFCEEL